MNSYAPGGGCTAPKAEFALYPVSTGKLAGFLYRDESLCATAEPWVIWARSAASAIGVLAVQGKGNTHDRHRRRAHAGQVHPAERPEHQLPGPRAGGDRLLTAKT